MIKFTFSGEFLNSAYCTKWNLSMYQNQHCERKHQWVIAKNILRLLKRATANTNFLVVKQKTNLAAYERILNISSMHNYSLCVCVFVCKYILRTSATKFFRVVRVYSAQSRWPNEWSVLIYLQNKHTRYTISDLRSGTTYDLTKVDKSWSNAWKSQLISCLMCVKR